LFSFIEGGIFWCYGLPTFARFEGLFSEYGWAWNRAPSGEHVLAKFVESFVIFLYGITKVWMERFGARSGDPYTAKQPQHIGITVSFALLQGTISLLPTSLRPCFAGLVGMAIELRQMRRWLASTFVPSDHSSASHDAELLCELQSHPVLVIGITGSFQVASPGR
jgi:hypothetical protein